MDITRFLPNDEYQAAINANNPSASNPFLTQADLAATGAYGYFSRSADGVAALPNTATAIVLDTTSLSSAVSLGAPASQIVVDNEGAYDIQFSAQLTNTSLADVTVTFWLRKNGSDVINTSKDITIPGNSLRYAADWGWLVDALVSDYYEIIFSTPDVATFLDADGARITPTRPALPSIAVSVVQTGAGASTGNIKSELLYPVSTLYTISGTGSHNILSNLYPVSPVVIDGRSRKIQIMCNYDKLSAGATTMNFSVTAGSLTLTFVDFPVSPATIAGRNMILEFDMIFGPANTLRATLRGYNRTAQSDAPSGGPYTVKGTGTWNKAIPNTITFAWNVVTGGADHELTVLQATSILI